MGLVGHGANLLRVGPYQLLERLGQGGMGTVWRAHGPEGAVAVKTVSVGDPRRLAALRRELGVLRTLAHPGVVPLRAHGVEDGAPWYAMDLLEGPTLGVWLRDRAGDVASETVGTLGTLGPSEPVPRLSATSAPQTPAASTRPDPQQTPSSPHRPPSTVHRDPPPGPAQSRRTSPRRPPGSAPVAAREPAATRQVPPPSTVHRPPSTDALRLLAEVAAALSYLHGEGLVHGDLKPSNVVVVGDRPVLVDFGLAARHADAVGQTTGGSAPWMAPERVRGEPIDGRADLYALGAMLYLALTGTQPFHRADRAATLRAQLEWVPAPPSVRCPGVDPALDRLVLALLAKDPRDRPGWADTVLEVLGGARTPVGRPHLVRPSLIGRAPLVARLDAVRGRVDDGAALVLAGPSGVGRTALLATLAQRCRRDGWSVVGLRTNGDAPLAAVGELLETVADRVTAGRAFEALATPGGCWLGAANPRLRTAVVPRLSPGGVGRAVRSALTELLRELAADGPLLLAVDDVDAADPVSAAWLAELAASPPAGVLLATTSVDGEAPGHRIDVGPLGDAAVAALVREACGEAPPDDLMAGLVARSGGFAGRAVRELERALARGDLHRERGRWVWPSALRADVSVLAPLEPLGPAARSTLEALAVAGPIAEHVVAAMVGPAVAAEGIALLLRGGWVVATGDALAVGDPGVAAATVDAIGELRTVALHRAAAQHTSGARAARHLEAAGDGVAAGRAWLEAAVDDQRHGAFEAAAAGYARAADLLPPAEAVEARRRRCVGVLVELGRLGDAEAGIRALLAEPHHDVVRSRLLLGLARVRWRGGHTADAEALLVESRDLALAHGAHMDAALPWNELGSLHHERGELDAAVACRREALAALDREDTSVGGPPPVFTAVPPAEQHAMNRAVYLGNLGGSLLAQRRFDEAEASLLAAAALLDDLPAWRHKRITLRGSLAILRLRRGDLDGAQAAFEQVLADSRAFGDRLNETITWQYLARVALMAGRDPEPALARGVALAAKYGYRPQRAALLNIRAEHRLVAGDLDGAAAVLDVVLDLAVAIQKWSLVHAVRVARCQVARRRGDLASAAVELEHAAALPGHEDHLAEWCAERDALAAAR